MYVPSAVSDDVVERRIVEQAARLDGHGAVTGWAALRLRGAAYFDGTAEAGRRRLPVALADERSRSPAESRMRLVWLLDAGLPRPLCNRPVFDLQG